MKKKALVVGSNGHSLAKECVNWGDQFYVGDFDFVFFNLTSLSQEILDKIMESDPYYFQSIRKHVVEIQTENRLPIWCIMDNIIFTSKVDLSERTDSFEQCNYGWSPVIPILERATGKEIKRDTSPLPVKYLRLINGWSGYYETVINNTGYEEKPKDHLYFRARTDSLLTNAADKDIAFSVNWLFRKEYSHGISPDLILVSKSSVVFLPKPSDVKAGIDAILEAHVLDKNEETPPSWVSDIKIVGEEKLESKIEESKLRLQSTESFISNKSQELRELQKYKQLLYRSSFSLEEIIEESLRLVGIELQKAEVEGKEDRVFIEDGVIIPVEIRGKDNSAITEEDIRQVISRLGGKDKGQKYKTRGVFILNHYRLTSPDERETAFHTNIIKDQAKPWDICLLSTHTIFKMVCDKLSGEDLSDIKDKMLNTNGVFEYEPRRKEKFPEGQTR